LANKHIFPLPEFPNRWVDATNIGGWGLPPPRLVSM